jgi:hypothetical protein
MRAVTVIGQHNELETGARRGCRDNVWRAATIGSVRMDVDGAGNSTVIVGREHVLRGRKRGDPENDNGGR